MAYCIVLNTEILDSHKLLSYVTWWILVVTISHHQLAPVDSRGFICLFCLQLKLKWFTQACLFVCKLQWFFASCCFTFIYHSANTVLFLLGFLHSFIVFMDGLMDEHNCSIDKENQVWMYFVNYCKKCTRYNIKVLSCIKNGSK